MLTSPLTSMYNHAITLFPDFLLRLDFQSFNIVGIIVVTCIVFGLSIFLLRASRNIRRSGLGRVTLSASDATSTIYSDGTNTYGPVERFFGRGAKIEFVVGPMSGRICVIHGQKENIGRDKKNDIIVSDDKFISRFHVCIFLENDVWYIKKLAPKNTVIVNGRDITDQTRLMDGDRVGLGKSTIFQFVINKKGAR